MKSLILKVAIGYILWTVFWIAMTISGNADGGVSAFLYLTITGLPFSLLVWYLLPNVGILSLIVMGAIGALQWVLLSIWLNSK